MRVEEGGPDAKFGAAASLGSDSGRAVAGIAGQQHDVAAVGLNLDLARTDARGGLDLQTALALGVQRDVLALTNAKAPRLRGFSQRARQDSNL